MSNEDFDPEINAVATRLFVVAYGAVAGELDLEGDKLKSWGESVARDTFILADAFITEREIRRNWAIRQQGRQV